MTNASGKITPVRAIDIVCNPYTPQLAAQRPEWSRRFLAEKIGVSPEIVQGVEVDSFLEKLDRAGVERAFLIAAKAGSATHAVNYQVSYEAVAELVAKYPDRLNGIAGVDPTEGLRGLRELEHAVKDLGFVGAHLYPHWFELPPDHARYYPIYSKCAELGVPIQIQVGHCLVYSKDRPLKSVGYPSALDTIACDFPELTLIGIHIGYPWTDEMISVSYKHENVYIGSDAYSPRYWPVSFVKYMKSWGKDKVLFGTDFPVIDHERAIAEIGELQVGEEALVRLLRHNAEAVYRL